MTRKLSSPFPDSPAHLCQPWLACHELFRLRDSQLYVQHHQDCCICKVCPQAMHELYNVLNIAPPGKLLPLSVVNIVSNASSCPHYCCCPGQCGFRQGGTQLLVGSLPSFVQDSTPI